MKILGYRKFNSKTNIPCCIVQALTEFSEAERNRGAFGQKVEEVWVPDKFQNLIIPSSVGKEITVAYNVGSDRKAYITDVKVQ